MPSISNLPGLSSKTKDKLALAGYMNTEELSCVKPLHLSYELGVSMEDANTMLNELKYASSKCSEVHPINLEDMLSTFDSNFISTSSKALDSLLNGGIPRAKMTELIGPPGLGKTQIGMQLSVNVAKNGGNVIFIDTEGSFVVKRFAEIAESALKAENSQESLQNMMRRIFYYRILDHAHLMEWAMALEEFLNSQSGVSLIVIDSIASPFRSGILSMNSRIQMLTGLFQRLMSLACQNSIAVVVTNQITTRFKNSNQSYFIPADGDSILVPSLGDSWGHVSTNRIMLSWQDGLRTAHLFKSSYLKEGSAAYSIEASGICDVEKEAI